MNKKSIAFAAAAVLSAGAALAQSSVTLYGRVNLSAEYQELSNGSKVKVLQNNASRIGFKGVEDLGGGLKAGFQLESGFSADTGVANASFFGRQSELNLSGAFGMVRMGNFTSEAYYATADYISLHNHDTGTSSDALYAYLTRNTNKIAYRTPELVKGLTLEAGVMAGEGRGPRNYDAALNWQVGPVHIGVGAEKAGEAWQAAVSALLEMGPFVVGAMIQRDEDGYGPGLGKRTNGRVSLAYNFAGKNELHLNVGKAGDYSRVRDSDAMQWTVAFNHNLSKRTKVYTFYTEVDASRFTPYAGDFKSFALGVRHNF